MDFSNQKDVVRFGNTLGEIYNHIVEAMNRIFAHAYGKKKISSLTVWYGNTRGLLVKNLHPRITKARKLLLDMQVRGVTDPRVVDALKTVRQIVPPLGATLVARSPMGMGDDAFGYRAAAGFVILLGLSPDPDDEHRLGNLLHAVLATDSCAKTSASLLGLAKITPSHSRPKAGADARYVLDALDRLIDAFDVLAHANLKLSAYFSAARAAALDVKMIGTE